MQKEELNSLDLTVKRMMLEYPSLYASRLECLENLFCTNGAGYDWVDGILINVHEDQDRPMPTKIKEAEPYDFGKMNGEMDEHEIIRLEREGVIRRFTEKNIDYLCQDYLHTGSRLSFSGVYPMSWNYCNMGKAADEPHNIHPDWRNGIREFIHWYLPEVNGKFGCYADSKRTSKNPDTSRLDPQTLENYEICRKVLDKIDTDADRIKHWLTRKDMKRMLHEIDAEEKQ